MTSLEELVEPYGLTLGEFTERLRGELAVRTAFDKRALTAPERETLASIGVADTDMDSSEPAAGVVQAAAGLLADSADTLTTDAMARTLNRSESRVRGAIADGSLAAVRIGRRWRLPVWQVADGRPIPHLRKVIAAKPDGVSWSLIGRVMTTPTDELYLDGHAVAPRHWLLAGRDPQPVVTLISMLFAW